MTPSSSPLKPFAPAPLALQIKDERWQDSGIDWPAEAARIVPLTLEVADTEGGTRAGTRTPGGEICLVFTNDAEVAALNKAWRGKDAPTNVLSFPAEEDRSNEILSDADQDDPVLGDVIFALETITREAQDQNKTFRNHATHLIVHGVLHLLGYDHQTGEEAGQMESLESKILAALDIADPWRRDDRQDL